MKKILWESMHIDDIEDGSDILSEEEVQDEDKDNLIPISGKLINTPIGIFDVDDKYNPLRQLELRIGYTNFDLDTEVANIIENSEGVEAFTVLTRYRFIIGIGKLFSFESVRKTIEDKLLDKGSITDNAIAVSKKLNTNKAYWALYEFPNGEIDTLETDSREEYEAKVNLYKEAKGLSGGEILMSEEV